MARVVRLGTRGSALALAQARLVAGRLERTGCVVEIVTIHTEGDRRAEARLSDVGGKGLFVREIEEALLAGQIDLAVHSLKDLPAVLPDGLGVAAFPEREDARDVLVTRRPGRFVDLAPHAVVGTSSPRRRAIALSLRPDLDVQPLRGNVDTRLRKLQEGQADAIILAAAGLLRLGITAEHVDALDPEVFVPAVGQGVLAVESRLDDARTSALVRTVDHAPTRACALAERAFLARLGASCLTPMAAHARLQGDSLRVSGLVASEDGRSVLREQARGAPAEAVALGLAVADRLLARGAADIAALHPAARDTA
jgi:hydroxymethylbilane synthase